MYRVLGVRTSNEGVEEEVLLEVVAAEEAVVVPPTNHWNPK